MVLLCWCVYTIQYEEYDDYILLYSTLLSVVNLMAVGFITGTWCTMCAVRMN